VTHNDLVILAYHWLSKRCSGVAFAEFGTSGACETPDVIGWRRGHSILIECKTNRADFFSDARKLPRRNPSLGMGRQRYFLCPPDVIRIDELPERWGLLWIRGSRIFTQCAAGNFPEINEYAERAFLVSMLRRAQIRLGSESLTDWLHMENARTRLRK